MTELRMRLATEDDLPAINQIYNHYVLNSVTTYQEEPDTLEGRQLWFGEHGQKYPVTVATVKTEVVGWASLSPFRVRSAYRYTVENSVYIHHGHLRRGIGRGSSWPIRSIAPDPPDFIRLSPESMPSNSEASACTRRWDLSKSPNYGRWAINSRAGSMLCICRSCSS